MRFIHASDLHLSETEVEYGFSVLEEILSVCAERKAGALVLSGDIFDSYADLKALYPRLRKTAEGAKGDFPVLAIPGNHDLLRGSGDLGRFDFGPRVVFAGESASPVVLESAEGPCEFILVPYGAQARDPIPGGGTGFPEASGKGPSKVLVVHGALPELNWLGPESEEGEARRSSLDSRSLLSLGPDYVALGHIHEAQAMRASGSLFAYPGSARVWRRGESGPRFALCVEVGGGGEARCEKIALERAGEYRRLVCGLDESGGIDSGLLEQSLEGCSPRDWIDISFLGVAQRELPLRQALEAYLAGLSARFRKVDAECGSVAFLGEEADSEAASEFRRAWKDLRPRLEEAYGREAALMSLQVGLSAIARAQEAKR